jgi:ketol-acid reductoisomerase
VPKSSLPSYPSEDGVLAGVTVELLKLLFPTEIAYINGKAEEENYTELLVELTCVVTLILELF